MNTGFTRFRYNDNLGYRLLNTKGPHAGDSTLTAPHYSLSYMLIYFKRGSGNIKIEGRSYHIAEGDIIILNPSELFYFTVNDNEYHERIVLYVNESLFKDFPYDCSSLLSPFYMRQKATRNRISADTVQKYGLGKILDDILIQTQSPEHISSVIGFCKTIELLHQLSMAVPMQAESDTEQIALNPIINEVLTYLDLHYKENIDIAQIASVFNIDKSYLAHLFKEHVGMSLWTYVILRRIQCFNEMIHKGGSIEENCYNSGFKNYSNFFRLYKKHMKMTPSDFKNQIKYASTKVLTTDKQ